MYRNSGYMKIKKYKFGITVPVHHETLGKNLLRCLESVFREIVFLEIIVISIDGPISTELQRIINEQAVSKKNVKTIKNDINTGLGQILNVTAKEYPEIDFWFRIDSDDWNINSRINNQIKIISVDLRHSIIR